MALIFYGLYLFLAAFNCGNMTTLQIQHYGIYPFVGKEGFKEYMQANNKSAVLPSILPAMLLLVVNILLLFYRPAFMSESLAIASLLLSITAMVSTFVWQRKLQGEMALTGYDEGKIKVLLGTNWIRVFAHLVQAVLAVGIVMCAISKYLA